MEYYILHYSGSIFIWFPYNGIDEDDEWSKGNQERKGAKEAVPTKNLIFFHHFHKILEKRNSSSNLLLLDRNKEGDEKSESEKEENKAEEERPQPDLIFGHKKIMAE